jgi:basic membrane protein A
MNKILKMAAVATFTLTALSAHAKAAEPAVIYDTAGKFDKSFNEAVFRGGVEEYKKAKKITVKEFEPQNEAQREQGLRRLASRGYSPIVAVGFNFSSSVEKIANSQKFNLLSSILWLINQMCNRWYLKNMKVLSWLAH